ncbi:hypothetical protein U9M48_002744 [Paspalum notatum var. saurae]|uniref:Uncharacterized protein n=1 Tax=Paspalum notatum var. saurae TaxID=547442 RepID=A0AAQ3SGC7_PASNO
MCVAPSFPATFRSPTNHRVRCRRWPPRGSGGVRGTGSGEGRIGGSHPLWSLSLEVNGKRRPPAGSPNTTSRHHPLESGTGMRAFSHSPPSFLKSDACLVESVTLCMHSWEIERPAMCRAEILSSRNRFSWQWYCYSLQNCYPTFHGE